VQDQDRSKILASLKSWMQSCELEGGRRVVMVGVWVEGEEMVCIDGFSQSMDTYPLAKGKYGKECKGKGIEVCIEIRKGRQDIA